MRKALSAVPLLLLVTGALLLSAPGPASAAAGPESIDAGADRTCAVVSAAVECWGRQSVDGRGTDPDGLLAGLRMTRVSAGGGHTCALSSEGRAYCWGANAEGQLGDGGAVRRTGPVAVDTGGALSGVTLTRISAGWLHTCALSASGGAYCWGSGRGGRLGDGATAPRRHPVPVDTGGVALVDISAGRAHTCAITSAGGAYCWGAGGHGQIGDGRAARSLVPVPVDTGGALSGVTLTQIAAGADHTCALSSAGAVYCWGQNTSGQLGVAGTEGSPVPVPVDTGGALSGVALTQIAAGANHTCALSSTGAAYCWGANAEGQTGDGGAADRWSPVAVVADPARPGVRLRAITAGDHHSCAASAAAVYCWGLDSSGRPGDATGRRGPVPTATPTPPVPPPPPTAPPAAGGGPKKAVPRVPAPPVAPAPPARITPPTKATRPPAPVAPSTTEEYDATPAYDVTPLRTESEPAAPPAAPPAKAVAPPPAEPVEPAVASGSPAAEPTQVAAVVLGMGFLVFAGTAAAAYRGRHRVRP